MTQAELERVLKRVAAYLRNGETMPMFVFTDDDGYKELRPELKKCNSNLEELRLSDCCQDSIRKPDFDDFNQHLEEHSFAPHLVLGMGEYLNLCSMEVAERLEPWLLRPCRNKAVFLLRGLNHLKAELEQRVPRFAERHSLLVGAVDGVAASPRIVLLGAAVSGQRKILNGFKELLRTLEDWVPGDADTVLARTAVKLPSIRYPVDHVSDAYDLLRLSRPGTALPEKRLGTDEQWRWLAGGVAESGDLNRLLSRHGYDKLDEATLCERYAETGDRNLCWLMWLAMKRHAEAFSNEYLRRVLDATDNFERFLPNLLDGLAEVPHNSKDYRRLYDARKRLLGGWRGGREDFIRRNRKNLAEAVYHLTDSTPEEREEVLRLIALNQSVPDDLPLIYPALADYLKPCPLRLDGGPDDLAAMLTDYFQDYKRQKVASRLDDGFREKVSELARQRPYNQLPTRENLLAAVDKDGACLCWVDALGMEFAAYLKSLAAKAGLSMSLKASRAALPSITACNHAFYDDWQGDKMPKIDGLDELKHEPNAESAAYLARELADLDECLAAVKERLRSGKCKRVVLTGDHGASRLVMLGAPAQSKCVADTPGRHAGRCCLVAGNDDQQAADDPAVVRDGDWLVRADYGLFKGGRAASLELHGGATLEEVVVPVITLAIQDASIEVTLVGEVTVSRLKGAVLALFVNTPMPGGLAVGYEGKTYPATMDKDDQHCTVQIPAINSKGDYTVTVYSGDNELQTLSFTAVSKARLAAKEGW